MAIRRDPEATAALADTATEPWQKVSQAMLRKGTKLKMCFTFRYRQWKQCYKVTTEIFTLIGWWQRQTWCTDVARGSWAIGLHLKTQRTTGNNSGKGNMQIGSSRGNYIGMSNSVHIWGTYTFQYMPWYTHIWSTPNNWKWIPEDSPFLVLFHASPVGWAWHLWMSLQCLSPHVSSLIRSTFGMLFECCLSWWDQVILSFWQSDQAWPCSQLCTTLAQQISPKLAGHYP